MKSIALILWLTLVCLLPVGCSNSRGTADNAGKGTLAERTAIKQVLEQDRAFHRARKLAKQYADSMATIDLQSCPSEFRQAYRKHIGAWEKNELNSIEETWGEVKRIAREYGVDMEPFE
jgi:hypothetical protein